MSAPLASELIHTRDRRAIPAAIALLAAVCWIATVRMALQPHAHHHGIGAASLGALFVMWAVMMAAMMIPPELPLFAAWARAQVEPDPREQNQMLAATLFVGTFGLCWTAFSLGAASLHASLQSAEMMDSNMALQSRTLGGALLIIAGVVQISPLKRACLIRCRAAMPPLSRPSLAALAGLRAGWLSVASCGVLMLIVFVPGVMSITWMILLTMLLVLERIAPKPFLISASAGATLIVWGALRIAV